MCKLQSWCPAPSAWGAHDDEYEDDNEDENEDNQDDNDDADDPHYHHTAAKDASSDDGDLAKRALRLPVCLICMFSGVSFHVFSSTCHDDHDDDGNDADDDDDDDNDDDNDNVDNNDNDYVDLGCLPFWEALCHQHFHNLRKILLDIRSFPPIGSI